MVLSIGDETKGGAQYKYLIALAIEHSVYVLALGSFV